MKYVHLSETVSIKRVSETPTRGIFNIEGLFTGYGITLGNALRRALLSSLPGAAITQLKIKGVSHEFSTLPGMMEDVIQFTLNLKKVRFIFFATEPQTLILKAKGAREVTAGDIQSNALVRVVNPDLHLATLTKKQAELEAELVVEKGMGYVPAEKRKTERLTIGAIALDAIFSPVVNVNFRVENIRVGERTDYNRLILDIETDGSITPSEALHKTSNVLRDHFDKISAIDILKTDIEEFVSIEEGKEDEEKKKKQKTKIVKKKNK